MGFFQVLTTVKLMGFVVALAVLLLRKDLVELSRCRAWILGVLWVAVASSESWILGPYSFLARQINGEFAVPGFIYLAKVWQGEAFSQAWAGGNDVRGVVSFSGQYVSLERILVGVLPLWLANAVHAVGSIAIAFVGSYLLARRGGQAQRAESLGLAAIASLSYTYLTNSSWAHGWGYSLISLAVYLCVVRLGRRRYWSGVLGLALLNTVSCTPTASVVALLPAIVMGGLAFGPKQMLRSFPAALVILAAVLVNWHESLFAMGQLAPLSFRGSNSGAITAPLGELLQDLFGQLMVSAELMWAVIASLIVLALRRRRHLLWPLVSLVSAIFIGPLIQRLPWHSLGPLHVLGGFNFTYIWFAYFAIAPLIVAFAASTLADRRPWRRLAVGLLMAAAVGQMVWHKAYNGAQWLSEGSIANYGAVGNLTERTWEAPTPTRVLSVPYRLPEVLALAAGLDTIDGNYNLLIASFTNFWSQAVLRHPLDMTSGFVTLETSALDLKCCESYRLADHVDVDMLRLANVGFVLTRLPLSDETLRHVAQPTSERRMPRHGDPLAQRLKTFWQMGFDPGPIHVYAIPDPLPRVYPASGMTVMPDGDTDESLVPAIRAQGPGRGIVVREGVSGGLEPRSDLEVERFAVIPDAITADVRAAEGGVLVFNLPFTPFWQAWADGHPIAAPVPANLAQMAVSVPKGAKRVEIRYSRPLLRDYLFGTVGHR